MSCCGDNPHGCDHQPTGTEQTLDEMDFEKGVWYAAQQGDMDRIKKLLNKPGAQVDQKAKWNYTALHFAARHGQLETCKYLVEKGANVNAITSLGCETPLHRACAGGHRDVVEFLISRGAKVELCDADGRTVLHVAAENSRREICQLLEKHCELLLDITDKKGRKPMHICNF